MGGASLRFFLFLAASALTLACFCGESVAGKGDYSYATPYAPEDRTAGGKDGEAVPDEDDVFDEIDVSSFIKPVQDVYIEGTVPELSKMYWAVGKFEMEDNQAIDHYLLINECDMYRRFYQNDFEWEKIREATRTLIKRNLAKFPTQFEVVLPIVLDRYDVDKKEFTIKEDSKIMGMRRLDFNNNPPFKDLCGIQGEILQYPRNIILVLNRPFSIEKVPVRPEIAEMYLEDSRMKFENLPAQLQMRKYERMAFLRLKVRITKYKETVTNIAGDLRAVVFGKIEGVEVYADSKKMKPMYLSKLQDKRVRKFRELSSDGAGIVPADAETGEEDAGDGKQQQQNIPH